MNKATQKRTCLFLALALCVPLLQGANIMIAHAQLLGETQLRNQGHVLRTTPGGSGVSGEIIRIPFDGYYTLQVSGSSGGIVRGLDLVPRRQYLHNVRLFAGDQFTISVLGVNGNQAQAGFFQTRGNPPPRRAGGTGGLPGGQAGEMGGPTVRFESDNIENWYAPPGGGGGGGYTLIGFSGNGVLPGVSGNAIHLPGGTGETERPSPTLPAVNGRGGAGGQRTGVPLSSSTAGGFGVAAFEIFAEPRMPLNLRAPRDLTTDSTVTLLWDENSNVRELVSYEIEMRTNTAERWEAVTLTATNGRFTVTGLNESTNYMFRIRARSNDSRIAFAGSTSLPGNTNYPAGMTTLIRGRHSAFPGGNNAVGLSVRTKSETQLSLERLEGLIRDLRLGDILTVSDLVTNFNVNQSIINGRFMRAYTDFITQYLIDIERNDLTQAEATLLVELVNLLDQHRRNPTQVTLTAILQRLVQLEDGEVKDNIINQHFSAYKTYINQYSPRTATEFQQIIDAVNLKSAYMATGNEATFTPFWNRLASLENTSMAGLASRFRKSAFSAYEDYLLIYRTDKGSALTTGEVWAVITTVDKVKRYNSQPTDNHRTLARTAINLLFEGALKNQLLGVIREVEVSPKSSLVQNAVDISADKDIANMNSMLDLTNESQTALRAFLSQEIEHLIVNYEGRKVLMARGNAVSLDIRQDNPHVSHFAARFMSDEGASKNARPQVAETDWEPLQAGEPLTIEFPSQRLHRGILYLRNLNRVMSEPVALNIQTDWTAPTGRIVKENIAQRAVTGNSIRAKIEVSDNTRGPIFAKINGEWQLVNGGFVSIQVPETRGLHTINITISDLNGNQAQLKETIWRL